MEKIIIFKKPVFTRQGPIPELLYLLSRSGANRVQHLSLVNGVVCDLPLGMEKDFINNPDVMAVEDNLQVKLDPVKAESLWPFGPPKGDGQIIPWGVNRIGANRVWAHARGHKVKVAVLDSGIDSEHRDLKANIKGGANIISPNQSPIDDNGHGTHVAGTIGAADNGVGVIGVAPLVSLYSVKIINRNGSGTLADIIKGLDWCVKNRMQVVNLSVGTKGNSVALRRAVEQTAARGVIMVAAAGNDGSGKSVDFPAAFPGVIAVGSIDESDRLSPFSNHGPGLTVVAPGSSVYSTARGGGYERLSGTSMAAPHVTGTIALALQINPRLNLQQITELLKGSSQKLSSLSAEEQGYGLVNAERMLSMVR
ncbi:S8 family peptidase [Desulfofalx alkaliphila]|uniref:S8 family peptidase n=1 Tax=Desulfofalx alkaliphila TaxID=105483 RepID=UPI00068FB189|nr:S8 family peptidase [Desulfofalx alkaliphila]